jgi:F-type H+-transporting ATPase subunit c
LLKEIEEVVRFIRITALVVVLFGIAAPLLAAGEPAPAAGEKAASAAAPAGLPMPILSSAFGAGMVIIGAGYGIAKLGSAAVESMARQPEVAGNIQTAMIIAAAILEGATFFALLVCIIKS